MAWKSWNRNPSWQSTAASSAGDGPTGSLPAWAVRNDKAEKEGREQAEAKLAALEKEQAEARAREKEAKEKAEREIELANFRKEQESALQSMKNSFASLLGQIRGTLQPTTAPDTGSRDVASDQSLASMIRRRLLKKTPSDESLLRHQRPRTPSRWRSRRHRRSPSRHRRRSPSTPRPRKSIRSTSALTRMALRLRQADSEEGSEQEADLQSRSRRTRSNGKTRSRSRSPSRGRERCGPTSTRPPRRPLPLPSPDRAPPTRKKPAGAKDEEEAEDAPEEARSSQDDDEVDEAPLLPSGSTKAFKTAKESICAALGMPYQKSHDKMTFIAFITAMTQHCNHAQINESMKVLRLRIHQRSWGAATRSEKLEIMVNTCS
jgi:hypothetical protein